jgi:hypothetical protein
VELKEVEKESVSEDNGAPEEKPDRKEDKGSADNGANEGFSTDGKGSKSNDESANEGCGFDNKQKNEKNEVDEREGENADNRSDYNGGFSHKTRIESQGKRAEITTNLTCDPAHTSYEWKKSAMTTAKNSSLGMSAEGESNNGSLKTIEMDGEATKFPHLHLPPGEVVITTVDSESESENNQSANNYQDEISKAATDFYNEFSKKPTALYYKIEQECSIPIGDSNDQSQDSGIEGNEYFRLAMSFNVAPKENG